MGLKFIPFDNVSPIGRKQRNNNNNVENEASL